MGTVDLPKSPHTFLRRPDSDVSRMPAQEDLQESLSQVLEEETGIIVRYLEGKFHPDAIKRLDIKGCINRHYQELFNRYAAPDNAPVPVIHHKPGEIAELLRSLGGAGKFNTGEIETSKKNRRSINDLEIYTNNILRQANGAGAFHHTDTAGSVVKCVFRNNAFRPGTVTDVKLAVNIPHSCLINPVYYHYAVSICLIKLVSRHIIENIEREINSSTDKKLEERISRLFTESNYSGFNTAAIRTHIENIRTNGFDRAVHSLAAILDNVQLDYQFFEHIRSGRELAIREYEDTAAASLPDERYQIRLKYFDDDQLAGECKKYDEQIRDFENKVQHLWDLIEVSYQDSKSVFKVNDFEDLAKKNKNRIRDFIKKKTGEPLYDISGENIHTSGTVHAQLTRMHERIKNMYEFLYPAERRFMEERLVWLEQECARLDFVINPRLLQPGLLIDVDITSIKQKRTTLNSMAAALEEFLHGLSADFQG